MRLAARVVLYTVFIIAGAVTLYDFLANVKLGTVVERLVEARYAMLARDGFQTIEQSLGLGMTLEQSANIQDVIDRLHRHAGVGAVVVFDAAGRVLYRAGATATGPPGAAPGKGAAQWHRLAVGGADRPGRHRLDAADADLVWLIHPLVYPHGERAGGIAVGYHRDESRAILAKAGAWQWRAGLAANVFAAIAAAAVALGLLRGTAHRFVRLADGIAALDQLTTASGVGGPAPWPATTPSGAPDPTIDQTLAALADQVADLAACADRIERAIDTAAGTTDPGPPA